MGLRNHQGKWQVRFQMAGVAVSHNTGLAATNANRNAASRIEAELRLAQRTGKRLVKPKSCNEAIDEYLEWGREEVKHSTWLSHRVSLTALRVFVAERLGGCAVAEITPGDIEIFKSWRRGQGIAANTLHGNLCTANKFFRWCAKHGWCASNPVTEVQRPQATNVREARVLSATDEAEYLAAAEGRFPSLHDLAVTMLDTGMRPEEVLRSRVEDVDLLHRTITVQHGKTTKARRTLWLSDRVLRVLAKRVQSAGADGWLWPSPRYEGQHMTKLNGPHEKVLTAINADWNIYDFRHTYATRRAQSGMDVATLAATLGHGSLRVVMRYMHPTPDHQIAMMRESLEGMPTSQAKIGQLSPHVRRGFPQSSANERQRKPMKSTKTGGAGRN